MVSPSVSMPVLADAFISHLVENRYVGPGVPSTVGITENNVKNIFNMVFKQQYIRVQGNIGNITSSDLVRFMVQDGYLVLDHGQVSSFPRHDIVCPVTTRTLSLTPAQAALVKTVKISPHSPLVLVSCVYPATSTPMDQLLAEVISRSAGLVFLTNTKFTEEMQGRVQVSWPGYGYVRKDKVGGGVILHHHSKLVVEEIKHTETDLSVLWVLLKDKKVVLGEKGMRLDRLTVVGCMAREEGDTGAVEYMDREVERMREQFGGQADIVLLLCNTGGLGMESGMAMHGMKMVKQEGRMIVMASQVMELETDTVEELVMVKQKNVFCHMCNVGFRNPAGLLEHQETGRHKKTRMYHYYQTHKDSLLTSPHELGLELEVEGADQGVEVGQEKGLVVITAKPNEPKTFKLKLRNGREPEGDEDNDPRNKPKGIVLEALGLAKEERVFNLHDEKGLTAEGTKLRLKHNLKFRVTVRACSGQIGHYRVPVIVAFYHEMHSEKVGQGENMRYVVSHMAMELLLKVQTDEMKDLRPTAPFRAPTRVRRWNVRETVAGKRAVKDNSEDHLRKVEELGHYQIKADRGKVISSNFQDGDTVGESEELGKCKGLLEEELGKELYKERWELLLHCEERQLETDIRHYDMADTKLKLDKNRKLFTLEVPGLEENRPSVMKGDKIFVLSHSDNREYEGIVHQIQEEKVLLGFSDKLNKVFVNGMKFDVRFTVGRFPLRNMHRAVVLAKTSGILPTLFPSPALLADTPTLPSIKCYDRKIETNLEQFSAVQHIVAGTSGRCPYLVFGPPGTGKTVTMVEAIKQVAKLSTSCHMLACAPSNTAADLLTERLVQHISKSNMIRIHASSRTVASIPTVVKEVSNLKEGKFFYPLLEQLEKYKVIVTTLVTAGRLVSAQFAKDHFTHVFIDESGQATEPESVIALAGLVSTRGQVVMAGDPKQLGPVIRSNMGVKHGLNISLLERLMAMELYSKDYDRRCITKLVKNFRSHKELLTIPKMLFYDNELDACADERMAESCLQFPGLPQEARRKKIPLVFHGVIGQDLKEETSPSFFNVEEIVIVLDYIRQICEMTKNKVLPKEIGVITPYRRQVQKIRAKLKKEGFEDVMVGSTEEFQGQERRVIIVSTVRSSPEYVTTDSQYKLGFLANPKRFNVAITRAKALLVIIGNPHILSQDPDWRTLLDFSLSKGCYTGCSYNQESDEDMDRLETRFRRLLVDESEISRLTRLEEPAWRVDL
eukprot:GFUD01139505.1.p1 GENE.GFUD01139505.1~~GFUD01139505.1.p1  ORF type:complete len:1236 (+),score=447.39 GFUD01139505.1:45-3752(+)